MEEEEEEGRSGWMLTHLTTDDSAVANGLRHSMERLTWRIEA
jgi:hypothetical protein